MEDAKMYAQRNQKGSGWFSYDTDKPATPAAAQAVPASQNNEPEKAGGVQKNGVAEAVPERVQLIKPKCDSNDWFKHDKSEVTVTAEPVVAPVSIVAAVKNEDVSIEQPKMIDTAVSVEPVISAVQAISLEDCTKATVTLIPDIKEDIPAAGATTRRDSKDGRESRDGRDSTECVANSRRDKMGTSADWFSHDHVAKVTSTGGGITARVTTKEGDQNASRMRGESENWFSYDTKKEVADTKTEVASAKQDQPIARGRANRQQNDDMHHIFHMGK